VSSLYSNSNSISQAFLPTHGMRFQGAGDVRVHDWSASRGAGTAATALRQRNADTALSSYPAASTSSTTNTGSTTNNGTIAGGLLRPGSIDQTQFKAMLAAAQSGAPGASGVATSPLPAAPSTGLLPLAPNAALAAQGLRPTSADALSMQGANAAAGVGGGIQNLTPAQFAALTGGATLPGSNAMAASAGGLPPTASMPTGAMPTASMPTGAMPAPAAAMAAASTAASAQTASVPPAGGVDTLTMSDAAIPPDGSQPPTPSAEDGTPIGSFDKNGVLVLNQAPDRDTRKEYVEKGIKWRLVDNPESNKLFFGPDGKLGWKDLLDLVNPLQHIPLVNIAYRHFTGDQPSGAAELLGALPFGPFSTMTAIADLAVRSTTGKDIGENVIAMVTGGDQTDTASNLAQAGGTAASNASEQVAEVAPEQAQPRLHDNK